MWAQIMGPSSLSDLRQIIAAWQPDVVVHDEGDYASPPAAASAGIPWVTHGWGSPLRPLSELTELTELTAGLWEACGLAVRPAGGLYAHALINPCPPLLQAHPPGAEVVWPINTQAGGNHDEALTADVYVGFGTVPIFADAGVELAAAVQACTRQGLRVLVTAPDPQLREQLQRIDEDLVDARPFVHLGALLQSCKLAICHGGAGTVLAALSAGVPLLIVPRGSPSQLRMAAAVRAGRCRPAVPRRRHRGRRGGDAQRSVADPRRPSRPTPDRGPAITSGRGRIPPSPRRLSMTRRRTERHVGAPRDRPDLGVTRSPPAKDEPERPELTAAPAAFRVNRSAGTVL